jgi:hypothetical protein
MDLFVNAPIFGLVTLFAAIPLTLGNMKLKCGATCLSEIWDNRTLISCRLKRAREDALGKEKKETYDAKCVCSR